MFILNGISEPVFYGYLRFIDLHGSGLEACFGRELRAQRAHYIPFVFNFIGLN